VEIVAEEDAVRAVIEARDRGREVERPAAKSLAPYDRLDGADHRAHMVEMGSGEKDRRRREQMWLALEDRGMETRGQRARFERAPQRLPIDGDAVTAAVEPLGERDGVGEHGTDI